MFMTQKKRYTTPTKLFIGPSCHMDETNRQLCSPLPISHAQSS